MQSISAVRLYESREIDAWWRFAEMVKLFNKKRMANYELSHILVFDESMSAFVPRLGISVVVHNLFPYAIYLLPTFVYSRFCMNSE